MKWLFSQFRQRNTTIHALYGAIVAQARSPSFYRDYGVADSVNGRFDMILLHAALVLDRTAGEAEPLREMGQGVYDEFCADMDANLREMGIGDLSVPKEMRRMAEAFYGRAAAYREALAEPGDAALVEAIRRNVFEGQSTAGAGPLALYVRDAVGRLRRQDTASLLAGRLDWPDPVPISAREGHKAD